MSFNESSLEIAIKNLLEKKGYPHYSGKHNFQNHELLIFGDFSNFLINKYGGYSLESEEISFLFNQFDKLSSVDLYSSNRFVLGLVSNGFLLKRKNKDKKDIYLNFIDYLTIDNNIFKFVTQKEIKGNELRIPDGILYINGLPLVVFEFKSAIREDATIYDAYQQLTVRYKRDIPELMKYNALCVISDGVNTKMGSLFAPYEFFYAC